MMHIENFPYVQKKNINFPLLYFNLNVFGLNLGVFLPHYFDHDAFMHHALHVQDALPCIHSRARLRYEIYTKTKWYFWIYTPPSHGVYFSFSRKRHIVHVHLLLKGPTFYSFHVFRSNLEIFLYFFIFFCSSYFIVNPFYYFQFPVAAQMSWQKYLRPSCRPGSQKW